MRFLLFVLLTPVLFAMACASGRAKQAGKSTPETPPDNPLLGEFETPFGVPPFDAIKPEHYEPAFEVAMERHAAEVDAIATSSQEPTFDNTVAALDYSGALLTRVARVFFNLHSADTSDELQAVAKTVAPKLSEHSDSILMNAELFARIQKIQDKKDDLGLGAEQQRLLKLYYDEFVRGGANLPPEKKAQLTDINRQLSVLSLEFEEHLLEENNTFVLVIEDEGDLAGLPESARSAAADAAGERGKEGAWVFTLHKPSLIPFLQYSEKRQLRQKMFEGYARRGDNGDARDNKEILAEIAKLRVERAHLLGYPTHAHYVLEDNMAKEPKQVYELLERLWKAALPVTKAEAKKLQSKIEKDGKDFQLEPWDWWYYAERVRQEEYDLSEEELRPYFVLENVQKGIFTVAGKLFGLEFVERTDLPVYHEDVGTYEVKDSDGSHLGIFYLDYHPRPGKRGGAWMNAFRSQRVEDGKKVTPVVSNVLNFSRPTGDKPALLSFEEVTTLFHEFGHALHGLLSDVTYPRLAGTSVPRDFVELPSQIMENWASEPEVLKLYAVHYETGETIPDELIEKIRKARHFNQGFETTEYLAASFLDMDWHTLESPELKDVDSFEKRSLDELGLIPEIVSRYRSTYFAHIFGGGYSAGYYSYIWAAVLDADAFQAFKENGDLFHPETAKAFREHVLSKGSTAEPMELYKRFRGAEPGIEPLLERRGLVTPAQSTN